MDDRSLNTEVLVSFVCQRCSQPLKLDASFSAVDDRLVTELAAPVVLLKPSVRVEVPSQAPSADGVVRKLTAPLQVVDSGNDFMLVGDNVHPDAARFSQHLEMTAQLFDVLTDQSEVEHPLCEECTDNLLDLMEKELSIAEAEVKDYKRYLNQLDSRSETEENSPEELATELARLQEKEREMIRELTRVEAEREEVFAKRDNIRNEKDKMEEEERRHFKEYMDLKRQWIWATDETVSVNNQLRYAQAQLDLLEKTNVFNATFHIWHDGHFGTINGFRLGRLPDVPVEWKEINIAWGQTVLLMSSLAKKMQFNFESHKLIPYGDHSRIECYNDKVVERLPLYYTGGLRFLWDIKFDQGMIAFLDCMAQFKHEVEKRNSGFILPYNMENGKIIDNNSQQGYNIKYHMNSEEEWTRALKYMLTNLKWAVAWCTSNIKEQQA